MVTAIIFAGGKGQRMKMMSPPKQFLLLYDKPIIVYTLEAYQQNQNIDRIIVSCLDGWQQYVEDQAKKWGISKLIKVVTGGSSSLESKINALTFMEGKYPDDEIILFHDAVRPIIDGEVIDANIKCTEVNGNAVTVDVFTETGVVVDDVSIKSIIPREKIKIAKAPQTLRYRDAIKYLKQAETLPSSATIDVCSIMVNLGVNVYTVVSNNHNIKITSPEDLYIFKALIDWKTEKQQKD